MQDEQIEVTPIDGKKFQVRRLIVEELEAKEVVAVLDQIKAGRENSAKQQEDAGKNVKVLDKRLAAFGVAEKQARLWAKEQELKDQRAGKKPEEKKDRKEVQPQI